MTFKAGVTRQGVQPPIWYVLGVLEMVYRANGLRFVVTSLTDGTHGEKSLHPKGMAADVRTRDIPTGLLEAILRMARSVLEPKGFDVVLEADHLHIEYDPKGSESWFTLAETA